MVHCKREWAQYLSFTEDSTQPRACPTHIHLTHTSHTHTHLSFCHIYTALAAVTAAHVMSIQKWTVAACRRLFSRCLIRLSVVTSPSTNRERLLPGDTDTERCRSPATLLGFLDDCYRLPTTRLMSLTVLPCVKVLQPKTFPLLPESLLSSLKSLGIETVRRSVCKTVVPLVSIHSQDTTKVAFGRTDLRSSRNYPRQRQTERMATPH